MIEEQLASIGLDEKERRFYLAILQLGSASVTEIAARAGVTRTNGYDLLARLEARGLVRQSTEDGPRVVVAEDPKVLISNWERTRTTLDGLVPELRSLFNATASRPRIRFYEGAEGITRVLWETLECRSGVLLGILSMHELLEIPGTDGMQRYIAERLKRRIRLRVLRSGGRETSKIWASSKSELREMRYAPPSIDLGMTMYINDETVSCLSSKRENYGLVIESAEFSALMRAMFEGVWTISTAKP